jgi:hypothetical protein
MLHDSRDNKGMTDPVPDEGVAEMWLNPVFFPVVFPIEIPIVGYWKI